MRFMFLYIGPGEMPQRDQDFIRTAAGVHVVDQADTMIFVESDDPLMVSEMVLELEDWIISDEVITDPEDEDLLD